MKNKNGKMIVLEGISGSGKSTIIDLLQQELKISNVESSKMCKFIFFPYRQFPELPVLYARINTVHI